MGHTCVLQAHCLPSATSPPAMTRGSAHSSSSAALSANSRARFRKVTVGSQHDAAAVSLSVRATTRVAVRQANHRQPPPRGTPSGAVNTPPHTVRDASSTQGLPPHKPHRRQHSSNSGACLFTPSLRSWVLPSWLTSWRRSWGWPSWRVSSWRTRAWGSSWWRTSSPVGGVRQGQGGSTGCAVTTGMVCCILPSTLPVGKAPSVTSKCTVVLCVWCGCCWPKLPRGVGRC